MARAGVTPVLGEHGNQVVFEIDGIWICGKGIRRAERKGERQMTHRHGDNRLHWTTLARSHSDGAECKVSIAAFRL